MNLLWKASRFNARTLNSDGTLIIYNSATGAIAGVPPEDVSDVRQAMTKGVLTTEPLEGIHEELAAGGFIIPLDKNEDEVLQSLIDARAQGIDKHFHLILLPTEDCNFRCVYCYEHFKRHKMKKEIQDSVVEWFERNAHNYDSIHVEWFGGEPLFADDVVLALGARLKSIADSKGLTHISSMTTNGYFLTPQMLQQLLAIDCASFAITIDGLQVDHDARRMLNGGGKTFDTIMENLIAAHESNLDFKIRIRHNFDPDSLPKADKFLNFVHENFGGDPRFGDVNIRAISKWNGPNDANFDTCDAKQGKEAKFELSKKAAKMGYHDYAIKEYMQPNGYVCYASNPNSLVIGADGQIMKCTLELDTEDRNVVGQVLENGVFSIDSEKVAAWVLSGTEDSVCRSCYFSPSCQGASCAKQRFDSGIRPCPTEKQTLAQSLRLLYQAEVYGEQLIELDVLN